eukprot:CAMPEP_0171118758 /NCGR_PEP_ID=MMETSP0766_2-20121228/95490_1 /TAXON_ID=439317 /ORGANISM="Gambierdiscus australes, Strain CAWD 149" /LENGTH=204 /DNA_ID=CAMNT_0011581369 /DNA_START=13 /DNA_END=627 /DNA_ORIENTATION=-
MAVCIRPGCGRPTWNGKPGGYCGRSCRDAGPHGSPVLCIRAGCNRPAFQGKQGNFCGRGCMAAGPATQAANEVPDPLACPSDGSKFTAWHGTSMSNAQAISGGQFAPSTGGNLGPGVYVAGQRKASRFAHDRHSDAPALVKVEVVVKNPKSVKGDNATWQQEGYDGCYAESTTLSPRPEWCIRDPSQITVLEIIDLSGQPRPAL